MNEKHKLNMNNPPTCWYMLWHRAKNIQHPRQSYWTVRWCVHRGGEKNKHHEVYLLWFHNMLCVCVWLPFIACFHFYLFHYFPDIRAPSERDWLHVISKWSQLRFCEIQKAIWLIRALRLAIHHKSHPALRVYQHASRALILMSIKAVKMSSKAASCVSLFVGNVEICHLLCAYVISDTDLHFILPDRPSIRTVDVARLSAICLPMS